MTHCTFGCLMSSIRLQIYWTVLLSRLFTQKRVEIDRLWASSQRASPNFPDLLSSNYYLRLHTFTTLIRVLRIETSNLQTSSSRSLDVSNSSTLVCLGASIFHHRRHVSGRSLQICYVSMFLLGKVTLCYSFPPITD